MAISKFEKLRRKISAICSYFYATEENPINCDTKDYMLLTIGHDEAMGLSELELPQITEIFHDNEGIVWTKIKGESEPRELCSLSDSDLKDIVNWFKEEMNIV